jgi:hypothetical protein
MKTILKWICISLFAALLIFITAEKLNYLKSDSLIALACSVELVSSETDPIKLLADNHDTLEAEALNYDLPPEMLAAVIYGHQRALTPFRKFTDCAGSAVGLNMSLGPAQVRISTAVNSDYLAYDGMPHSEFKAYRKNLLDPAQNIKYEAQILRRLLDRDHRYPGISAQEIIHDPFVMALVMSEYRGGAQEADNESSRLSGNAFYDLEHLLREGVFIYNRDPSEVTEIQGKVVDYLDYIYCDSGIFNESVCENSRESLPK